MFDEKQLSKAFGASDEGFKNNFDNVLAKLKDEEIPHRAGHKRFRIVAIALVVCLMLTGTAFAINQIFFDRADVGASWVLVTAPEDYIESNNIKMYRGIYTGSEYVTADRQPQVDADTAQVLRELFEGVIFTADGEPVDFVDVTNDSDRFRIDVGNGALYNADGEELWEIHYLTIGNSEPQSLMLQTKDEYEMQRERERQGIDGIKLTDDYAEAALLLGSDFRLPSVYTEDFSPPEFRYQSGRPSNNGSVYVRYYGSPGIFYFAEALRDESELPEDWYAPGAVIEQCEIAGEMVYKATSSDIDGRLVRYTWTHENVAYMFFQWPDEPDEFNDEQVVEIIASMIK